MARFRKIDWLCSLAAVLALGLTACRFGPPKFEQTTEEFVFTTLSFSPVAATAAGYHRHAGVPLDELLDDVSEESFNRQRGFYRAFSRALEKTKRERLTPEDKADYDLIVNQAQLALLELDSIQRYKHDPNFYVELAGQAIFGPLTLEYAPKDLRFFHIARRLESFPALLLNAQRNLVDSPEIHNQVARDGIQGLITLIEGTLRNEAPEEMKGKFDGAAKQAIDALRGFDKYLVSDLGNKVSDWRLDASRYASKFQLAQMSDRLPGQVLADAELALADVRRQMSDLTKGNVRKVLDQIARTHARREDFHSSAQRDLDETTAFVQAKVIVPLLSNENLKVIPTPAFFRGSYPVGGFNPAPPLEPNLEAQYWLTPIPPDWPAARVESKLREYNTFGLKLLTIHEAMPGHYVQFEYANAIQPQARRLLRTLYGSGTYVEGWAVYVTQVMIEEGYLNSDSSLRLTYLKQLLRAIANAILDIRMHTRGMTDDEALKLMIEDTFQEREEAEAKLRRVKLTSCQLPTYFVGYVDWLRLRERYRGFKGRSFSLPDFHATVLREGAVPVATLSQTLTGEPLPEKLAGSIGLAPAPAED